MRRATGHHAGIEHHVDISIHALREEGDEPNCALSCLISISIHALRKEGDQRHAASTSRSGYFYPHPPRGGQLGIGTRIVEVQVISIHALREEGDALNGVGVTTAINQFLSTPSVRRATAYQGRHHKGITISIHALREEGDRERLAEVARQVISIHALREEGDSVVAV